MIILCVAHFNDAINGTGFGLSKIIKFNYVLLTSSANTDFFNSASENDLCLRKYCQD